MPALTGVHRVVASGFPSGVSRSHRFPVAPMTPVRWGCHIRAANSDARSPASRTYDPGALGLALADNQSDRVLSMRRIYDPDALGLSYLAAARTMSHL